MNPKPIERFCARVRQMHASRSKDLCMPADEAVLLSTSLTAVLAHLAAIENELRQLRAVTSGTVLDGGNVG